MKAFKLTLTVALVTWIVFCVAWALTHSVKAADKQVPLLCERQPLTPPQGYTAMPLPDGGTVPVDDREARGWERWTCAPAGSPSKVPMVDVQWQRNPR